MSSKRLHIHGLPVALFALATLVVSALPAAVVQAGLDGAGLALLRPAVRLESGDRGFVKVATNQPVAEEPAGIHVELPADNQALPATYQAVNSIGLQVFLGRVAE